MRLCMNLSIFLYTPKQKLGIVPVGGNYNKQNRKKSNDTSYSFYAKFRREVPV